MREEELKGEIVNDRWLRVWTSSEQALPAMPRTSSGSEKWTVVHLDIQLIFHLIPGWASTTVAEAEGSASPLSHAACESRGCLC